MEPPQRPVDIVSPGRSVWISRAASFSIKSPLDSTLLDGADGEVDPDQLVNGPEWEYLDPSQKRGELFKAVQREDKVTLERFQKRYGTAISQCLSYRGDPDVTILHYLIRKYEPYEFDNSESFKQLTMAALLLVKKRLNDEGLSESPPMLVYAIERKHFGLVRFVCEATAKYASLETLVAEAIGAKNSSKQNSLHAAISLDPMNFDITDTLIKHGGQKTFALERSNGNTPLHDFVQFTKKRFSVPSRKCPVEACEHCHRRYPNLITDERKYASRFVKTLRDLINQYPTALSVTNNDGKTPYVIHIEGRNASNADWVGLEYEPEEKSVNANNDSRASAAVPSTSTITTTNDQDQATQAVGSQSKKKVASSQREKKPAESGPNDESGQKSVPKHAEPEWNESQHLAGQVARHLLEQCSSREDFDEAVKCIFGDRKVNPLSSSTGKTVQIAFKTENALYENIESDHEFLKLHSILACVELKLASSRATDKLERAAPSITPTLRGANASLTPNAQRERNVKHLNTVLQWLREVKKVKRILKLVIKDNQDFQCEDEIIEECLKGWDIRCLDWNKQNLSIETIKRGEAGKLVELWLTWNGQNSCLVGWSDPEFGLKRMLPKLHLVHVNVDSSIESVARLKECLAEFKTRLHNRFPDLLFDSPLNLRTGIKSDDERDNKKSGFSVQKENLSQHRWIQAVSEFRKEVVKNFNMLRPKSDGYMRVKKNPVRVAVIDDGVNPSELTSKGSVKEGWPPDNLTQHGNVGTFYNSADGHGTVMANLIGSICPYVHLYVAKLEKSTTAYSSVAQMAAEAVNWAVSWDVQIISMSWTIKEKPENAQGAENLRAAIEAAGKAGVVLFCSSDDKGMYEQAVALPASSQTTMIKKVGSCNENGNMSEFVNPDNVDYLLPGEKLDEVISDGAVTKTDKGSSASTALASGLAALVLWCSELYGYDKSDFKNERMYALFDKLKMESKSATAASLVNVTGLLNDARETDNPVKSFMERVREKMVDELREYEKIKASLKNQRQASS